jgi:hypothetical protein
MDAKALCVLTTLVLSGCASWITGSTSKELPVAPSATARPVTAGQAEVGYANGSQVVATPDSRVAVHAIANAVADCERSNTIKSLFVDLSDALAATPSEREAALAERLAAGDANRACKRIGREKNRDVANLVLGDFYRHGLADLAKDYLVQAQATLDAVGDKGAYKTESRKLSALLHRVDFELSISANK